MPVHLKRAELIPRTGWEFLPFQFERWSDDTVLLTNLVGEHLFLTAAEFASVMDRDAAQGDLVRRLRAKHIVRAVGETLPVELLAMKYRTQHHQLADFTGLHMFVVTLRCDHTCRYCQVSSRKVTRADLDMTEDVARLGVQMMFQSPSDYLKVEFQGGEPLLNFPIVRSIVHEAERLNASQHRELSFVIASNLAPLDDEILDFCQEHDVWFSTSLDGPADLHNSNRPRPGEDSWQLTVDGIARIRRRLGPDRVSALMTTTRVSLSRVKDIIDCYIEQGFHDVFLRPVSPYGVAVRHRRVSDYDVREWVDFYTEGLEYILELNARGIPVVETYAALILKKMLTNVSPRYVDLCSPAGLGIGALLYNYDGAVYPSDEGRMLAEMGDTTFRLGHLGKDTYQQMLASSALLDPLEDSFALSVPMCCDCAFERFCGASPVLHHATMGDPVGRKPESVFCRRNKAIFRLLLNKLRDEPAAASVFRRWAAR